VIYGRGGSFASRAGLLFAAIGVAAIGVGAVDERGAGGWVLIGALAIDYGACEGSFLPGGRGGLFCFGAVQQHIAFDTVARIIGILKSTVIASHSKILNSSKRSIESWQVGFLERSTGKKRFFPWRDGLIFLRWKQRKDTTFMIGFW
jgi:hypothetical protein